LLAPAISEGDAAALLIADRAALELVLLAKAVLSRLSLAKPELAMLGSILTHCAPVRERVEGLLTSQFPELSIIAPRRDAAYGAALCALSQRILEG
jgi:N-acetylglucosamine kinase-like BadF-type ATPase